ncbi:MAG: carboxypeptidase regulatory-like domain-containing protein [Verrucomicrobiaceae bacterium]|nr:carboxypeptidase regulatory-like domain-containing protein [Verrucomicrobiaceae bacterium]
MKKLTVASSVLFLAALTAGSARSAEVFEAALGRETELPGGKEADGILGDFVLRSDKVEAVVSHNAPNRRANMSTFYGPDGVSPGCLYDLTLRGANNDQLVVFGPGPFPHGPVSYVREAVAKDGAAVESVTTAARNGGIFKRTEYRVRDGFSGVFVTTILRNETDKSQRLSTGSDLTRFNVKGEVEGGIQWMDAINPAHRCGYAYGVIKFDGAPKSDGNFEIAPKAEVVIQRFFAVATSPAAAIGEVRRVKGEKLAQVSGTIVDDKGQPVSTATILVRDGKNEVPGYTDDKGRYNFLVKPSAADWKVTDLGRSDASIQVPSGESEIKVAPVALAAVSRVQFDITDAEGRSVPCKVLFEGIDGTPQPNLGPRERAHGCADQYHSERGQFTVALPAGKYRISVLHGVEFGRLQKDVDLEQGAEVVFSGKLVRQVDTKGWISSDFHNHSTPSGDNVCDTDGRVINLAAEHIEFAPTTEHNRFFDWMSTIEALGLKSYIATVKGIELTGSRQHFNAFPFEPDRFQQDGGAPVWNDDPRITAITLRRWQGERPDRWIQFNHPDLSNMFVDRDGDGVADGGFVGVGDLIDGMESQNGMTTNILADAPFAVTRPPGAVAAKVQNIREFVWKQLLNQGHRLVAVAVSDAHSVYGNGVGGWRIFLPSSTDEPEKITWEDLSPHAKAGHIVLSTGPFLQVSTPDGKIAGDDVRATGGVDLKVKVQCADWQDIDRVQVLVNSRPEPSLNFTRKSHPDMFKDGVVKFDQTVHVPLQQDAHLIVVAMHETMTLAGGYGTSEQSKLRPCAYNNPIYVDVDGGGFTPNGDTLGFDLPTMKISADMAKERLQRAGLVQEKPAETK